MANTSITVTFVSETASEDQSISVELDDEKNKEVYGAEKSRFLYGEKAYFKVYKYPPDMSITMTPSDGTLTDEGSGTSDEESNITFANDAEGSASKPVKQITSSKWLGNDLGAVAAVGTKVSAAQEGVGVLKLGYKSDFTRHAITVGTKDEDEYPVIVFISSEDDE